MANKVKEKMPDFASMSDEELVGAPSDSTAIQGGVSKSASAKMPDFSKMSDEELVGFNEESAPPEESKPDFIQGAVQAGGQFLGNLAEGTARGTDNLDRAAFNISQQLSPLAKLFPATVQPPPQNNLEAATHKQFQGAIEQGQKEHPILSQAGQAIGESLPTIPAWETGAGAAGGAIKAGQLALRAAQPMGALGSTMLSTAKALAPALGQEILHLTTTGCAGAFVAGMQEVAGKPGAQGGKPPNLIDMVKGGIEKAQETAPFAAVMGGIAAGVLKIKALHVAKMQTKIEEQAFKDQVSAKDIQAKSAQMRADNEKTVTGKLIERETNQSEGIAAMQAARQSAIDEMKAAVDEQKARLDRLEKAQTERDALEAQANKQNQLSLTKKRGENNVGPPTRKIPPPPPEDPAVQQEIDKLKADMALKREEILQANREHAAKIRMEIDEMRRGGGDPAYVHPVARPTETTPVQTGPKSFSLSATKAGEDAETVHGLTKGRGNRGRAANQANNPEQANDGFLPSDQSDFDAGSHSSVDTSSDLEGAARLAIEEREARKYFDSLKPEDKQIVIRGRKNVPELLGSSLEGLAFLNVMKAWESLPSSEKTYDGFMHLCGIQKNSDIKLATDKELHDAWAGAGEAISKLGGGLFHQSKQLAGKVSFAHLGAGEIDTKLLQKGVRGKLTPDEMKLLTPEQQRAVKESHEAVQAYLGVAKPILKWLDENAQDVPENVGLGRLRGVLRQEVEDLEGVYTGANGRGDNLLNRLMGGLMQFMFYGKAANSIIHAGEKGVALAAHEGPLGLGKAIVDAYKPGPLREFNRQMSPVGPLTESFDDVGIQAKNKVVKLLTGRVIERSPQDVATTLGLGRAAKKFGYKDAESLAKDLIDARSGTGPLAYDTQKTIDIMSDVQHYVSDVTGSNAPGLRDANIFQRNEKLKMANLFLSMPGLQARNFHILIKGAVESKGVRQRAAAMAKLTTYAIGLYLIAGEEGPIPREAEDPLRHIFGDPAWYRMMDALHGARSATGLSAIPHLQHSLSPMLSGGANAYEIFQKAFSDAGKQDPDAINKAVSIAKAIGMAAGVPGGGVAIDYIKAARDAQAGHKTFKVYKRGLFGANQHIADIPVETNYGEEVASKWAGGENAKLMELSYQARKTTDFRNYVRERVSEQDMRDYVQSEKDIDSVGEVGDSKQEENETLKDLYDSGMAKDSPEVRDLKEKYQGKLAKGDLQTKFWRMRANYWQRMADEVDKKPKQGVSSSKPQA